MSVLFKRCVCMYVFSISLAFIFFNIFIKTCIFNQKWFSYIYIMLLSYYIFLNMSMKIILIYFIQFLNSNTHIYMINSCFAISDPPGFSTFFFSFKAYYYKLENWYTILNQIFHSNFKLLIIENLVIHLRWVYTKLCFTSPVSHL